MRKYPIMLTAKSSKAINAQADELAAQTMRTRSQFVRDVIKVLASDQNLQQAVNLALGPAQPER